MAGFTPFSDNYRDLSDQHGYQFEFRCDVCGSGYRSEFIRSTLGTAGSLLSGASSVLGGFLSGASNVADRAKGIADRGARDDALRKASAEIMPLFTRCPRCNSWVDSTCWNVARGLCVRCAPNLAAELEAERASLEVRQMREAMANETVFSGDTSARQTICASCGKPVGSEKFCSNCGTPTGQNTCAQCGNELAAGVRFCGNCGTKAF